MAWKLAGLLALLAFSFVSPAGEADEDELLANTGKINLAVLESVEIFRQVAALSPREAVEAFMDEGAAAKFTQIGQKWFEEEAELCWSYFFHTSLISARWFAGDNAVVVFHQPWSDAALLVHWRISAETKPISDLAMIPGDLLRSPSKLSYQVAPPLLRGSILTPPVEVVLAVGETFVGFENMFPTPPMLAPTPAAAALDARLADLNKRTELEAVAAARLLGAINAVWTILEEPSLAGVLEILPAHLKLLDDGDLEPLMPAFPGDDADTIAGFKTLAGTLADWSEVAMARAGGDTLVFMAGDDPRLVVCFWYRTSQGQLPSEPVLRHLTMIDFRLAPFVFKKFQEEVEP